ncbi:Uncharacterised protein [Mycobacteroides abscessus subsp. abscessus]|nr:Uncharacterised protein [Mycobacteroides abscessus subsp. abscessus]
MRVWVSTYSTVSSICASTPGAVVAIAVTSASMRRVSRSSTASIRFSFPAKRRWMVMRLMPARRAMSSRLDRRMPTWRIRSSAASMIRSSTSS